MIILLGDPGAGKTHCFRAMAEAENACYCSVDQFIARGGRTGAKTVYLDGLDESRPSLSQFANPTIAVLQLLRNNGNPRVRLSCRFADWLGGTDLPLFRDYCDPKQFAVLVLEPLNEEEAVEVLTAHNVKTPRAFLMEARVRHMDWLISNPQNLLMLTGVVEDSGWPRTKSDLYERSCERYLRENKPSVQGSLLGRYAPNELLDPAGAACALLLISGVEGIKRTGSSDPERPSYRTVPYSRPEEVLAALGRPAFVSIEPELATYVHRTTAEYLAARWVGELVKHGLPLSRILALIGVDGHPSPSLRGFHAWLATFIPRHASALISKDPVGVLAYGDVASLCDSHKVDLIRALGALAAEDAWFLKDGLSDYGLSGLSSAATAEHILSILQSPAEPILLKILVLQAILIEEPLPCYHSELERVLTDSSAVLRLRHLAFQSLLKFGFSGEEAIVRAWKATLENEPNAIGLRAAIVARMYSNPFGPMDVVRILIDASRVRPQVIGDLFSLERSIPAMGLLEVLEKYEIKSARSRTSGGSPDFEVPRSVERMLVRVCGAIAEDDLDSVHRLLKLLRRFYESNFRPHAGPGDFGQVFLRRPQLLSALVDCALRHHKEFQHQPSLGTTLNSITGTTVAAELVAQRLKAELERWGPNQFSEDQLVSYDTLGRCICSAPSAGTGMFDVFLEIGRNRVECAEILGSYTYCEIPEWRVQPSPYQISLKEFRVYLETRIGKEGTALLWGGAPNLQGELASVYFGFYGEDGKHRRRQQLVLAVGEMQTQLVERGFAALVESDSAPKLSDITLSHAGDTIDYLWYAFLAGLDLIWQDRGSLDGIPDETLASALAVSLLLSTFDDNGVACDCATREWSQFISRNRPDVAEPVFSALLSERLRAQKGISSLLYNLPAAIDAPWRSRLGLNLLIDFEVRDQWDLRSLCFLAAETVEGRVQLAIIANDRVFSRPAYRPSEFPLWVVVGLALVGEPFEAPLEAMAFGDPAAIWTIRSLSQPSWDASSASSHFDLTLKQVELMVCSFGRKYPNRGRLASDEGAENDYEAALYLGGLITSIATLAAREAGNSLLRLLACQDLASYHAWIRSRCSEQREVNRRSRYQRPTWGAVCASLSGLAPANIEDLKALFLQTVADAASDVRHSNLDKYRIYWHGTRYSCTSPRDENFCRDRLVEYLRERLSPIGLRVEPEGYMAENKRADIVVYAPNNLKLPVEVKRDNNPDLWTAPTDQLERMYTRDPEAQGYGVYLVFYFGPGRGGNITPRPDGVALNESSEDLAEKISAAIPPKDRGRISSVVFDVSPPGYRREARTPPKQGTAAKRAGGRKPEKEPNSPGAARKKVTRKTSGRSKSEGLM